MRQKRQVKQHVSEAQWIMDAIRADIFAGALRPGDLLQELKLARQYGVSQTTVREALTRLENAGFVRRVPNARTFITQLSVDELREHIRLRLLLESLAVADAARRMTPEALDELKRRLEDIARTVQANAYFESAIADLEFHRWIWKCAGDRTLYRVLDQLTAPLFASISIRRSSGGEDLKRVVLSHQPIVEALESRDPEAARQAIRAHIENSYLHLLELDFDAVARFGPVAEQGVGKSPASA